MKRKILLLMMTALLSVGAWAQSLQTKVLWTGEQTVTSSDPLTIAKSELQGARIGSQICIYLSLSGDATWGYNINYYGTSWKTTWSGKGDNLVVSAYIDNDILSYNNPLNIYAQDQDNTTPTCTVTKVTLNYNGANLLTNAEGWDPSWNGTQLKCSNASEGDVLAVAIKANSITYDWGTVNGKLYLQSATGNPEKTDDTDLYTGNEALTGSGVTIAGSVFSEIVEGDKLAFSGTGGGEGDKKTIIVTSNDVELDKNDWWYTSTIEVTSSNIETIKTYGVVVTGAVGTLAKVTKQSIPAGRPTGYCYYEGFSANATLYIPLTSELASYAQANTLYIGGWGYTVTSVDLIYPSDVNIASVSTGTVLADKTKALEGETVTLTVTPTANYQFGSLTVTDATGAAVPTSGSGNTYTFTMPATAVTVSATFTPTVPTALNTENIKLINSQRGHEDDGTVKLWIDSSEENGWDFTIGRPVSSTEFAGVEVKYKQALDNVQMVITYGDDTYDTESFSAAEGSTNTAYITFAAGKIVKSIKFRKPNPSADGMIQFQSSSAVRLVGIVGASTYVPTTSLTLTYETLEDGGGNSVTKVPENSEFTIEEGVGHWAGWIFTLPIPTSLYKGVNFNMTSVPENGAIEIVYESSDPQTLTQTLKLSEGNNIVNFVHGGNITQIKFNVAGTYRMGECSASNTYLAKVTDSKYATYCAVNDAIDFSTSGLKAYIAKVEDNKVKLNEVSKVPANTAVVLYADVEETTSYTLSTTAEITDNVTANQLRVSDGTVKGDGSTIYVLAKYGDVVGFYLLESGDELAAGKAYLEVEVSGEPGGNGARQFIGFGDDNGATGIDSLTPALSKGEEVYYDLQGRRVAQPTKGLYIVNGKKIIIK